MSMWAQCGAAVCPHNLKDLEKCDICNVIIFDRPLDSLKDIPFDDLMIASPRSRIPAEEDLPDLLKRLKGENALIELDSRTKFKKQKDYVHAHLAPAGSQSNAHEVKPSVVHFVENANHEARSVLFPKIEIPGRQQTFESNSMTRLNSIATSQTTENNDALVLVTGDSIGTARIKIHISPFNGDVAEIVVDSAVTVSQVINAIVDWKKLDMTCFWTLRWVEDEEGHPDYDLPPIDMNQILTNLNATELCLCSPDDERSSDDSSD